MRYFRVIVGVSVALMAWAGAASAAWKVKDETSQLDGTRIYVATIVSTNRVPNSLGIEDVAGLIVRCKAGKLVVYVNWPDYMGEDGDGVKMVKSRFDQGPIDTSAWDASSEGTATFAPEPTDFLRAIASSKTLVVAASPHDKDGVEAVFDLTGSGEIARAAAGACPS